MHNGSVSQYNHITDDKAFDAYVDQLRSAGASPNSASAHGNGLPDGHGALSMAVDLEAEMNLHIYGEHFCLLQLFDGKQAAVVDPYSVSVDKIGSFLEDDSITKIFYDAASDRNLLYKNHGILIHGILDLKPAVELLGLSKQGLDSVLEGVLGLEPVSGKSRFQKYDWTRRPIRSDAVDYALRDVLHLFALRDELLSRLEAAGKTAEFYKENSRREAIVPDLDRKPGMFRTRRFERMSDAAKAEFERIYNIRDTCAQQLNVPPHLVLSKDQLFDLAAGKLRADQLQRAPRIPANVFDALKQKLG